MQLPPEEEVARDFNLRYPSTQAMLDDFDRQDCEDSLYEFIQHMWPVLEPYTPFVPGWHLEAVCEHLEAVTNGEITRLMINIPPGSMKSLMVNVLWPAWEWIHKPGLRYVAFSYSSHLTERDNDKFHKVIISDKYRRWWGGRFMPSGGKIKLSNDKTGFKYASSVEGTGTGERGDRVIIDDPNNVKQAESEAIRTNTNLWFKEVIPSRLNDLKRSAIILIQQRAHANDVSGVILAERLPYEKLIIPMEYEPDHRCVTSIGWGDPRTKAGELMCPERFGAPEVEQLKKDLGVYATAAQLQQIPAPRGGGIIKRAWWLPYTPQKNTKGTLEYPAMEYIIAAVDTAYTEDTQNDNSAMVVWGLWRDEFNLPKVMLMDAWEKRVTLHGDAPPAKARLSVQQEHWGLVEWVAHTCRKWRVHKLLIEDKAAGHSVAQEIRRLCSMEGFSTQLINYRGDKTARVYSVEPLFSGGIIYAPERQWAEAVIDSVCTFPRAAHDDLCDAACIGLKYLRETGWALRKDEGARDWARQTAPPGKQEPLYDV